MKNYITLLFVSLSLILTSCSSSDDSNDMETQLPTENSFSVTIDGQLYTFDTFIALKVFDNYEVLGSNSNQENFYLRFNQNGVLDRANFYVIDGSFDNDYNSAFYNPDFNLTNLTFDMSQNIVSASFNGNIYQDDLDITSTSRTVESGSFNLTFTVNQADPNLDEFINATINGQSYETIKHGTTGGAAGSTIVGNFGISDGTITTTIYVDASNIQTGTFNFTEGSAINKVSFEYVNPFDDDNDYEELDASGTLIIDTIIEGALFDLIQGTFTATATSTSGETYVVENGTFNVSISL